ncbi:MAG: TIGR00730 family Rossman fold protein [Rhizobiales bacterium]|nr:TIGR00730 family Rossman fold protein [Hyphomicrobiales bacterium]
MPFGDRRVTRVSSEKDIGFPHAREDMARADDVAETAQTQSPAYRLAFADMDFMVRRELRPVRFQLELLKPEMLLAEHDIRSTVVVFGSARIPTPDACRPEELVTRPGRVLDKKRVYEEARKLARIASVEGQKERSEGRQFVVVTGGGPGIMEAANRGAADVDAESIGLNIVLPHEQAPNAYITPELCFQFHYFAIRKMHFMMRARALVCFPGGFGTMDELFEALTLIQTGKAKRIPLLLFDEAYWRRIVNFEAMVEEGVISPEDLDLFRYVETADQAWAIIADYHGLEPHKRNGAAS